MAAVKVATNSASVEPNASTVWVSLLRAIAPPAKVKTGPVIDLCFLSSEPQQLASTKPVNLGWETSTVQQLFGTELIPDSWILVGH